MEADFSQQESFPQPQNMSVSYYLSNYYCSRKLILSFVDQHFTWRLGAANLITVEILFFLVSRYENLGELCMHFELQVCSPWTNLAEIWPIVVTYKTVSANFNSSFHFKVLGYFSLAVAMISHPRIYLFVRMKQRHTTEIWDTVF